jgi:hypothetical protein
MSISIFPVVRFFFLVFLSAQEGAVKPQTGPSWQVPAGKASAPALVRSRLEEGGSSVSFGT